jgi:4-hydroxybenzoate polyprenyltransferase
MRNYLSLVKFSHTIFALPFAILGLCLGFFQSGTFIPDWAVLPKVIACMVFARSAAMAFNRYVDRGIDEINPRTRNREIPAGKIKARSALVFTLISCFLFVATTYFINRLCLILSPVALLVILGYSYTKRFTSLCHLILGLGLSLAPIGAYLAVTGTFDLVPVLYSFGVLFWVAGFDIIYAMQDESFDAKHKLYSIPVKFGATQALLISTIMHVLCAGFIVAGALLSAKLIGSLFLLHWLGALIFIGLLAYQHRLVKPGHLEKVDVAFFTTNGVASILFCALFVFDLIL